MDRQTSHRELDVGRLLAGLLVTAIVVGSIVVALLVAVRHERDLEREQRAEVRRVAIALEGISSLSVGQLRTAAAFLELRPRIGRSEFERLIETLTSEHPVASVSFLEATHLPGATVAGSVPILRDGDQALTVRLRSSGRPEGDLLPVDGDDLRHLNKILGEARRSENGRISRAIELEGAEGRDLVYFHPVRSPDAVAQGAQRAAPGLVAGVLPVPDLLDSAAAIAPAGAELALVETDGEILAQNPVDIDDFSASPVTIAGRSGWELRLALPQSQIWALPLFLGLAGISLAAMIGLLLFNWARRERTTLDLARTRLEQRDRAIEAEAETNRMYRLLAENLTDMVMVTEPDGVITYVSPAGRHILGWTAEEMIGKPILSFLYSDDEDDAREHLASLREAAGIHTFEHRLRHRDGSYVWVESAVRSIFDPATDQIVEFQATTRDISERKPLQEQLERLAREDPLTGLSNRRLFYETLAAELARARRSSEACTVMLIDIDRFKLINDVHGHLVGDRVLRRVGSALKSRMRLSDTTARLGGDEFAAILPETDRAQGRKVAANMMDAVRSTFTAEGDLPEVTVSIGIAAYEGESGTTPEHLIEQADLALYAAKDAGRNRFRVFGSEAKTGS